MSSHVPAVDPTQPIPEPPGTVAIRPGQVRLFHRTAADPSAISREGLLVAKSRGPSYGEPRLVWGSCRLNDLDLGGQVVVEFVLDWEKLLDNPWNSVGGPIRGTRTDPAAFMARGGNVGVAWDVPPSDIVAVHEPWHHNYRFIAGDSRALDEVLGGQLNYQADHPDYGPAIERVKLDFGSTSPEPTLQL